MIRTRAKYNFTSSLLFIFSFLFPLTLLSRGFLAGTLVKTPTGHTNIEDLRPGDLVVCENSLRLPSQKPIITVTRQKVPSYQKIYLRDIRNNRTVINTANDQKLFVTEKEWINIARIRNSDRIEAHHGHHFLIEFQEKIHQEVMLYDLVIAEHHNFFITTHDICAHNFDLISFSMLFGLGSIECLWFGAQTFSILGLITFFAKQIFTERIFGFWNNISSTRYGELSDSVEHPELTGLDIDKNQWISRDVLLRSKHSKHKNNKAQKKIEAKDHKNNNGGGGNKKNGDGDQDDLQNSKSPKRIYEPADYHKQGSQGRKNGSIPNRRGLKGPDIPDPQKDLDVSIGISEKLRIAINKALNKFSIFNKTLTRANGVEEWHGHLRDWCELSQVMKNTLIKNGLTNARGKIL